MTLAGNLGRLVLVCRREDAEALPPLPRECGPVLSGDGLCLYALNSIEQASELHEKVNKSSRFTLRRYLDRFYLLVSNDKVEKRQETLDKFFNLIGFEYESFIDVPRNLDNIRNLLEFMNRFAPHLNGATILDYGCGTGLSIGPATDLGINLVGLDRCPTMCQIARTRGMMVWNFEEFSRNSLLQISGAFASYVFHLLPQTDGLCLVWDHLRSGGVFVANFHKNQGIEAVNECVTHLGGIIRKLETPAGAERHGAYFAYIKN